MREGRRDRKRHERSLTRSAALAVAKLVPTLFRAKRGRGFNSEQT